MNATVPRWLARVGGAALVVLLVSWVGWRDRVVDARGVERTGRITAREVDRVRLAPEGGGAPRWIDVQDQGYARTGLRSVLLSIARAPATAALGFSLHALGLLLSFARWGVLLRGAGLRTPPGEVLRLSWVGQFTAMLLPGGIASGDLVKAVAVARHHPDRRTRAVLTIGMDRFVGLLALGAIAGAALLFAPRVEELAPARTVLIALFAFAAALALLVFSPRAWRWRPVAWLVRRLPFPAVVTEIGAALALFRARRGRLAGAWVIGAAGQLLYLAAFAFYARAMDAPLPLLALGAGIPAALVVQSIPALPGGWGLGEAGFVVALGAFGVAPGAALGLSIVQRTLHTLLALPGGLLLTRGSRGAGAAAV